MSLRNFVKSLRSAFRSPRLRSRWPRRSTFRPRLELLEDRCVPALYAITDLGTLSGNVIAATDLNEAGQVVGYSSSRAFLWENGTMIDLGTLGGRYSSAAGINDLGQVVGRSNLPENTTQHAFLINPQGGVWFQDSDLDGRNDLMIDLGTLNGSDDSEATDINNAGLVVGSSAGHAFLWDVASGMTDLGTPLGFTQSYAAGINEAGQVTGTASYYDSLTGSRESAFLWDAANGMIALGAGPTYLDSQAAALNDAGQIVGHQGAPQIDPAFLWTPDSPNGLTGSFTDLGMLPGAIDSNATAINNAGQVVGSSTLVEISEYCDFYDFYGCHQYYYYYIYHPHAFLWDAAGGMVDLQNQLAPGSDATLQDAQAINDGGSIAANGLIGGRLGAFVLTPIPPGTPFISIADAPAVTEGDAGTVEATFTVSLSLVSDQIVTVGFTTVAGSAAGSDYQTQSGTLTFTPGETSKTITVAVIGDRLGELNEMFSVNLSGATNAIIVDDQGVGAIMDDEPRIHVNSVNREEGNSGTTPFVFTVTLSLAYDAPVTVKFATADGSATVGGNDYVATSGTLTFAPGETSKPISVLVIGDRLPDADGEAFYLNLSELSSNAIFLSPGLPVLGRITDEEPRISIDNVTNAEGKNRKTTLFTFTVTLSAAYDQPVTMSFRTVNGTATTSDNDYVAKSGTLTFAPGETTKTIIIDVKGDRNDEASETFYLDLFGLSGNASFTKNRGVGTILNDD